MAIRKRFSELSTQQQGLVRLCQAVHFGQILDLHVGDGAPVFAPEPKVIRDVKLDSLDAPRPELELSDFALRDEVCRLFSQIEALKNGRISRIEVHAGLPRRIVLEGKASDIRSWLWTAS